MGTKINPGEFDFHAKAAPDEPLFTLVARDPLAPELVSLWAALRDHDWHAAATIFGQLLGESMELVRERPDKVDEAMECAQAMRAWHERRAIAAGLGISPETVTAAPVRTVVPGGGGRAR